MPKAGLSKGKVWSKAEPYNPPEIRRRTNNTPAAPRRGNELSRRRQETESHLSQINTEVQEPPKSRLEALWQGVKDSIEESKEQGRVANQINAEVPVNAPRYNAGNHDISVLTNEHGVSNVTPDTGYALDAGRQQTAEQVNRRMAGDAFGRALLTGGEGYLKGATLNVTDLARQDDNIAGLTPEETAAVRGSLSGKIGNFAGQMGGYMLTSGGAAGALQNTGTGAKILDSVTNSSLGKLLTNWPWLKNAITRSLAKKGIEATEDMVLGKAGEFVTRLGIDLMTDIPMGIIQSHNQAIGDGIEFDSPEYWRNMALNTGLDVAAGGLMNTAPILWNAAGNVFRPNAFRRGASDAAEETLETAAEQAARTATRGPRLQEGATFSRGELPRLNAAEEATGGLQRGARGPAAGGTRFSIGENTPRLRTVDDRIDDVLRQIDNKRAAKLNDDILYARTGMASADARTRARGSKTRARIEERLRDLLDSDNLTNGMTSAEKDALARRAFERAYNNIHTGGDLRGQAYSYEGIRQSLRSVEDSGVGDFIRGLDADTMARANNASPREAYEILEQEARKLPRPEGMTDEAYEAMIRDRTQQGYNVLKEEAARPARQLPTQKELENAPDLSYNNNAGGLENGPEQNIANAAGAGDNLGDAAGEIQEMAPRSGGSEVVPGRGVQPASGGGYDANDVLTPQHREVANRYNVTNTMKDSSNDYPSFIDYIDANKATQKYGIAVDTPSAEKLSQRGAKAYLVNNGNACIAVASDGDVIALVKKSGAPHTDFDEAMITAIANGGTKCDAYGIRLTNGYAEYGFEPVARIPYDPNVIREIYGENAEAALSTFKQIAPPGREGPDVYVFMHNGDDLETVLRKNRAGEYKVWTQEELDALPTFTGSPDSYEEALAYRDNLLNERLNKTNAGGNGPGDYPGGTTGGYTNDVVDVSGIREGGRSSTVGYHDYHGDTNIRNNSTISDETKHLYDTATRTETEHRSVKEALKNGEARIEELGGTQRALTRWNNFVKSNTRVQSDDWALGFTLAKKLDEAGDHFNSASVYNDLAQLGSDSARITQMQVLLRDLSPIGREEAVLQMAEKMAERHGVDVRVTDELMDMLHNANGEKEVGAVLDAIQVDLWNQVPLTLWDKLKSFRYLAMLGNPKTHIRNIVGNVIFTPARRMSDFIATAMEQALPQAQRTRTFTHDKDLMDLGRVVLDASRGNLDSVTRWKPSIRANGARAFDSRVLQLINDASTYSLEHGDTIFSDPEFIRQFAGYIQAKGYNINTVTRELVDEAAEVATRRSLEATFRNENLIADAINSLKRSGRVANFFTEAAIPFVKTPSNVLIKAVHYTPVGIADGVRKLLKAGGDSRLVTDAISEMAEGLTGTGIMTLGWFLAREGIIQPSLDTSTAEGKFRSENGEQAYSINIGDHSYTLDWAAPAVVPLMVGAEMNKWFEDSDFSTFDVSDFAGILEGFSGMLNPVFDMSMLSGLENALDVGQQSKLNPVVAVGANTLKNYGSSFVPSVLRQIARTATPDRRTTTSTAESPAERDLERYVRGLISGIPGANNLLEPYVNNLGERDSKRNPNDYLKAAVQNFLSPGTLATRRDEPVTNELQSLVGRVSEEEARAVIPPNVSGYTVSLGGQEYRMTESELTKFKETRGQYSRQHLNALFNSDAYKQMTDQEKVEAVKDIYADALHHAQDEFMMDHGMTRTDVDFYRLSGQTQAKYDESYMDKQLFVNTYNTIRPYSTNNGKAMAAAEAGLSLDGLHYFNDIKEDQWWQAQYAVQQGLTASQVEEIGKACDLDGNGSRKRDEIIAYLDSQSLTREQKMVLFDMLSTSKKNPYR